MQSIYAIIVTFNGLKWIDKCFGSLISSTIPLKILAIDNASTDGTPKIIKQKYPNVEVIETGENLGFGKANNIGLKRVLDEKADFAFLLNQDAWIEPNTVQELVNISLSNKNLGIISPVHLNGNGDALDRNFHYYLSNDYTPDFYSDLYLKKSKNYYESKFANAAAWLVTYDCLNKIGGFDPLFKHYGEDDDFINRMHLIGLKLAITPNTTICHDRPQSGNVNNASKDKTIYKHALLRLRSKTKPSKNLLFRKIIASYFLYYFVYFKRSNKTKNEIDLDVQTLKLMMKKLPHNLKIQL